jgi:DNA-binding CsgD family transcriptional regulator
MMTGRFGEALPLFEVSREHAQRHGDVDAVVLAGSGAAYCTEMLGRPQDAIAMLDEVMVDVVAKPVAPQVVGLVYCSMIALCMKYLDIGRAREWTRALAQWCDEQSGLVPYRGACTVHRAELLQFEGSWPQAEAIAQAASRPPADAAVAGLAHYRLAEILRLRGRLDAAEDEYRAAARNGCEVQPGLAMLRAAQGRLAAAQSALDRVGSGDGGSGCTPAVTAARIEIALLRGDLNTAEQAVDELAGLADAPGAAPYLRALAAHGAGSVLLAQGRARPALADLRRAVSLWSRLDAPYEAARTRVLIADACAAQGDADTAVLERDSAREAFDELGAAADVQAIDARRTAGSGLSHREIEVLRALATGASNRAIAENLTLSEKTVARHLSNIFGKLGVASRSAATAYAYRHNLA